MTYRVTKKAKEQLAWMRDAKEARRIAGQAPEYPPALPGLRRRITIENFDFGHETHVIEMHRTSRVDCYMVTVDGKPWKGRIGWSKILAGLRKSIPRVSSA